jgi:hypothetical protein
VEDLNAERSAGLRHAAGGSPISVLGSTRYQGTALSEPKQAASPEAVSACRDLVFESLIETGSLAESYSRSLTEAAWRGDRSTVEVHLRQLRACVLAAIDIFKQIDAVEPKGGVL